MGTFDLMDKGQNLIGYIYYSGDLRVDTLNKKTDKLFLKILKTTKFQDEQMRRLKQNLKTQQATWGLALWRLYEYILIDITLLSDISI